MSVVVTGVENIDDKPSISHPCSGSLGEKEQPNWEQSAPSQVLQELQN